MNNNGSRVIVLLLCTILGIQGQISVSGISSGGFAAVQYHVIYSSHLQGAAIIAGGPFWCANAYVGYALTSCMEYPELIFVSELIAATTYAESLNSIDYTGNLANHYVWLFSGSQDSVVVPGVVQKLNDYYSYYVNNSRIKSTFNVPAEHSFVTENYGNDCSYLGSPYINNCGIDTAGDLLQHIYGPLKPKVTAKSANIQTIQQSQYIPPPYTPTLAGLQDVAYFYLPNACANMSTVCKLHISFHGCQQTIDDIQDTFFTKVGLNEWAEANNIIVLYPQAVKTVLNPEGCFDWWGYTGVDYATYFGAQMATVKNMMDYLVQTYKIH